jgi:hypothetical protein
MLHFFSDPSVPDPDQHLESLRGIQESAREQLRTKPSITSGPMRIRRDALTDARAIEQVETTAPPTRIA